MGFTLCLQSDVFGGDPPNGPLNTAANIQAWWRSKSHFTAWAAGEKVAALSQNEATRLCARWQTSGLRRWWCAFDASQSLKNLPSIGAPIFWISALSYTPFWFSQVVDCQVVTFHPYNIEVLGLQKCNNFAALRQASIWCFVAGGHWRGKKSRPINYCSSDNKLPKKNKLLIILWKKCISYVAFTSLRLNPPPLLHCNLSLAERGMNTEGATCTCNCASVSKEPLGWGIY